MLFPPLGGRLMNYCKQDLLIHKILFQVMERNLGIMTLLIEYLWCQMAFPWTPCSPQMKNSLCGSSKPALNIRKSKVFVGLLNLNICCITESVHSEIILL